MYNVTDVSSYRSNSAIMNWGPGTHRKYDYNTTVSDIDECTLNINGCDHNCTNTFGSYTCSCRAGCELAANGHSCEGTIN